MEENDLIEIFVIASFFLLSIILATWFSGSILWAFFVCAMLIPAAIWVKRRSHKERLFKTSRLEFYAIPSIILFITVLSVWWNNDILWYSLVLLVLIQIIIFWRRVRQ